MVTIPSPIVQLKIPEADEKKVAVMMKRDDLIHPEIMGNKWRKLKYNLDEAKKLGKQTLLTFGGAFSNHIAATAAAGREYGFHSIGIIRGDELNENSNPTLQKAAENGMQFEFVSRESFRELKNDLIAVQEAHPDAYILPEGGTNPLAIKGAAEIVTEIDVKYDFIVCPVGTGGTMAGILNALPSEKKVIGISSLKGAWIQGEFQELLHQNQIKKKNWEMLEGYHFGGYGKTDDTLINFINHFQNAHKIQLDPIYTGKMMFGVYDLIKKGFFPSKSKIMVLHTGGLQGIAGFNFKKGNVIL
ncbi:MAG: pyridoxal-phosphate dependent enzyme [Cyclobacteriaceae bacterium]